MIASYFRVALRTLRRHRVHTTLTVLGLALGMAVCLLVGAFAWHLASFDQFHAQSDRIVRILTDRLERDGETTALGATPAPLGAEIQADVPGVEAVVRIGELTTSAVHDGRATPLTGLFADPTFFDVFDFATTQGDGRQALATPGNLLLTADAAERIFGSADPIGQTVTLEGRSGGAFVVAGLLADPPGPSHLRFEALASFGSVAANDASDWGNTWTFATYLLLDQPQTAERVAAALPALAARTYDTPARTTFRVQPLRDIALGPYLGNEVSSYSVPAVVIYFLSALGLVVMLAAGFNYVSLTIARSLERAREIGARKTLGAGRRQVTAQLLAESALASVLATVVAALLLVLLVPGFNSLAFVQLFDVQIQMRHLLDPRLIGLFALFGVGVGVIAGLYPALRLARATPLAALRGGSTSGRASGRRLRFSLVGAQLGVALLFVLTTALLGAQFRHLAQAEYGFDQRDVLTVDLQGQSFDVFRSEVEAQPGVAVVAGTSMLPVSGLTSGAQLRRVGSDSTAADVYAATPEFSRALNLEFVAGQPLGAGGRAAAGTVVLNQTATRRLGFDAPGDAIGAALTLTVGAGRQVEVVGVVRDYQYDLPTEGIGSMVLHTAPERIRFAVVRTQPGALSQVEADVASLWKRLDPVHPVAMQRFEAQISDGPIRHMLAAFNRMLTVVSLLALVISCLGLLGMAAYHVESRVKEVGVRKVLGASRAAVVWLLSREFVALTLVVVLIAVPLTLVLAGAWLDVFAVRTQIDPLLVIGCVGLTAAAALGVVVSQTLRAASADPVASLRAE